MAKLWIAQGGINLWCGRGDLNPHAFRRHPLKMVCLPIPPLPQGSFDHSAGRPLARRSKVLVDYNKPLSAFSARSLALLAPIARYRIAKINSPPKMTTEGMASIRM